MMQGDFDKALQLLNNALQLQPSDISIWNDKQYIYFLQRDYSSAIEIGRKSTAMKEADEQSFQLLGLCYTAIADYKSADKLYKDALAKFPKSGLLYNDYGEMLRESKNEAAAIKQWEAGIATDPNISSNYYNAARYYAQKENVLWCILYAEIFCNLESYSKRTAEIKTLFVQQYVKLFVDAGLLNSYMKSGSAFEKAVASVLYELKTVIKPELTPQVLSVLRIRFIAAWYNQYAKEFPYRLFALQRQLIQENYFDAYNQWLTGAAIDSKQFESWINAHGDEVKAYQNFQQNVMFKWPDGQYYAH